MPGKVIARREKIVIPTYATDPAETLPMFAENRVHQRVSGNPYPNRVVTHVLDREKKDKEYTAIRLENDWISLIILPEIGGKIFAATDKTNGYDFFYRQHVIKPALIGMLGLWISGGVEFNWPVHHRPSTFLPVDWKIERDGRGATVWLSENEPLGRMKGMVGIRLESGSARIETRMRVYNTTGIPQSFLFWENAAVPVNPRYRIFFPCDVSYVNFHYKKARGGWPVMHSYFNNQDNRRGNDIRFHKNTEHATSYFCGPTSFDFFGGYDEGKKAGVIHWADRHVSLGKKMFTWGYLRMASSWRSALTDADGDYAELMASSYSDNQPDLTWLESGEVRTFRQWWYPFKDLGEVFQASLHCAAGRNGEKLGIYPVEDISSAFVAVMKGGKEIFRRKSDFTATVPRSFRVPGLDGSCSVRVTGSRGEELLSFDPVPNTHYVPKPWKDNPAPDDLEDPEGCYLCGLHVDQYRDPLISGEPYFRRGLEMDKDHPDCLKGLGIDLLRELRYEEAEECFRRAIASLTRFNPHPRDTEPFHLLALSLIGQGRDDEAREEECKALWNQKTLPQAYLVLVRLAMKKKEWDEAIKLVREAREYAGWQQEEAVLEAACERKKGNAAAAAALLEDVLSRDPLYDFALYESAFLRGKSYHASSNRTQVTLDAAQSYAAAGLWEEATHVLDFPTEDPLVLYCRGYCSRDPSLYRKASGRKTLTRFPARPLEKAALEDAVRTDPGDREAQLLLGDLLYGVCRDRKGALSSWEKAGDGAEALRNRALALFALDNGDSRVIPLLDEARKKEPDHFQIAQERLLAGELQGEDPEKRLALWQDLMQKEHGGRDEAYLLGVRAANEAGMWKKAVELLEKHDFIPCEGGEHQVSGEYLFATFALGLDSADKGRWKDALAWFEKGLRLPDCLGGGVWHEVLQVRHLILSGVCLSRLGQEEDARKAWEKADDYPVNYFTQMYLPSVKIWKGIAEALRGNEEGKQALVHEALEEADAALGKKDYAPFSTTPFFISYREDPARARRRTYLTRRGLALAALGRTGEARACWKEAAQIPGSRDAALLLRFNLPIA